MTVILQNITKRPRHMVTLNLTKAIEPVRIQRLRQATDRRGRSGVRLEDTVIPGAIHLAVGARSKPLPDSVLEAPEVKNALARRWIKSQKVDVPTPKVEETTIAPPELPQGKPGDFKLTEEASGGVNQAKEKGASPGPKTRKRSGK